MRLKFYPFVGSSDDYTEGGKKYVGNVLKGNVLTVPIMKTFRNYLGK